MREGDRREAAAVGQSPLTALQESLSESSVAYTALIDSQPAAMFGLLPQAMIGERAGVWLLTAERVSTISALTFVRTSRRVIDYFLTLYPVLENWVDVRYVASIRWLQIFGARFDDVRELGPERVPFRHFVLRREREAK